MCRSPSDSRPHSAIISICGAATLCQDDGQTPGIEHDAAVHALESGGARQRDSPARSAVVRTELWIILETAKVSEGKVNG
jgi:hypothetical protein